MDKMKLSRILNILNRIDMEIGGLSELLRKRKYQPVPVPVKNNPVPRQ